MTRQIVRREPLEFSAFPGVREVFGQLLSDPFFSQVSASVDEGSLALDVSEDERSVIVRASVPGFTKDQINVEVHDGVLSINARQSEEKEEKGERFYRRERRFGSVSRRVALPCAVVETDAKADLKDGVLTLRLPKSQKELPKKISIN